MNNRSEMHSSEESLHFAEETYIYGLCTHALATHELWHMMSPQALYGHIHEWASVHSVSVTFL